MSRVSRFELSDRHNKTTITTKKSTLKSKQHPEYTNIYDVNLFKVSPFIKLLICKVFIRSPIWELPKTIFEYSFFHLQTIQRGRNCAMSGEPQNKRMKLTDKKGKWNHFKKPSRNARIEIGYRGRPLCRSSLYDELSCCDNESFDLGFLATCNFREKDCRREAFNILTTYADQLYGAANENGNTSPSKADDIDDVTEPDDISTELQNEIDAINSSNRKKLLRFQHVDTDIANLVFVKTTLRNPVELGTHIVGDIAGTRKSISRFLLRFIPVEFVCKATLDDIKTTAGKLFDIHFLNCAPKTFSIIINRRYNNSIQRDEIIEELAGLVAYKNVHHKVDLKNAECSVIVEILKGICCLSVLPNYLKWKKYNISELVLGKTTSIAAAKDGETDTTAAAVVTSDTKTEKAEAVEEESN